MKLNNFGLVLQHRPDKAELPSVGRSFVWFARGLPSRLSFEFVLGEGGSKEFTN